MAGNKSTGIGNKDTGNDRADSTVDGITIVSPDSAAGGSGDTRDSNSGGTGKRPVGRPRGSGTAAKSATKSAAKSAPRKRAPRKTAANQGIVGVEKILFSIHAMAASALKIDELALDDEESKALANAVNEVASHYDISPDPKVVAWAGLIGTCASIYAPRVAAYKMRTAAEKRDKKELDKPMSTKVQEAQPTEHDPVAPFIEPLPVSNIL